MHGTLLIIAPPNVDPVEYVDQVMSLYPADQRFSWHDFYDIKGEWPKQCTMVNGEEVEQVMEGPVQAVKNFNLLTLEWLAEDVFIHAVTTYKEYDKVFFADPPHYPHQLKAHEQLRKDWRRNFYDIFLKDLEPDDQLILVDYHS